jgi:alanyl-tRNA synthetase
LLFAARSMLALLDSCNGEASSSECDCSLLQRRANPSSPSSRMSSATPERAGVDYAAADERTKTALKVIADHIRAVVYLISDRVQPTNLGRGYIVRRLLRRVVLKGRLLGVKRPFTAAVAQVAIDMSGDCDLQARRPTG